MEQITVPARLDRLESVLNFAGSLMTRAGMDKKQQSNIMIAVEEIFVNIATYAYPSGEGEVMFKMAFPPGKVALEFADSGIPYNPLVKEDPDTSLSVEDREAGGLGIYMVKNMMDSMEYRYEENKNILVLEKRLVFRR